MFIHFFTVFSNNLRYQTTECRVAAQ